MCKIVRLPKEGPVISCGSNDYYSFLRGFFDLLVKERDLEGEISKTEKRREYAVKYTTEKKKRGRPFDIIPFQ